MKDHHLALLLQLLFPSRLNFNKVTIFQSLHSINKYEHTYCNCSSCPPPLKFVNATTHLTVPEVASEMTALLLEMWGTSTNTRNLGDFAFTVAENADTTYVVIHGHHGMLRQNLDQQIWALSQNDVLGFICIFAHQIWPCPRPWHKRWPCQKPKHACNITFNCFIFILFNRNLRLWETIAANMIFLITSSGIICRQVKVLLSLHHAIQDPYLITAAHKVSWECTIQVHQETAGKWTQTWTCNDLLFNKMHRTHVPSLAANPDTNENESETFRSKRSDQDYHLVEWLNYQGETVWAAQRELRDEFRASSPA